MHCLDHSYTYTPPSTPRTWRSTHLYPGRFRWTDVVRHRRCLRHTTYTLGPSRLHHSCTFLPTSTRLSTATAHCTPHCTDSSRTHLLFCTPFYRTSAAPPVALLHCCTRLHTTHYGTHTHTHSRTTCYAHTYAMLHGRTCYTHALPLATLHLHAPPFRAYLVSTCTQPHHLARTPHAHHPHHYAPYSIYCVRIVTTVLHSAIHRYAACVTLVLHTTAPTWTGSAADTTILNCVFIVGVWYTACTTRPHPFTTCRCTTYHGGHAATYVLRRSSWGLVAFFADVSDNRKLLLQLHLHATVLTTANTMTGYVPDDIHSIFLTAGRSATRVPLNTRTLVSPPPAGPAPDHQAC